MTPVTSAEHLMDNCVEGFRRAVAIECKMVSPTSNILCTSRVLDYAVEPCRVLARPFAASIISFFVRRFLCLLKRINTRRKLASCLVTNTALSPKFAVPLFALCSGSDMFLRTDNPNWA